MFWKELDILQTSSANRGQRPWLHQRVLSGCDSKTQSRENLGAQSQHTLVARNVLEGECLNLSELGRSFSYAVCCF